MTQPVKAVEIEAELKRIRSLDNGLIQVTLELPEYCMPQVKVMLDWLKLQVKAVIQLS